MKESLISVAVVFILTVILMIALRPKGNIENLDLKLSPQPSPTTTPVVFRERKTPKPKVSATHHAEKWIITAYCPCRQCSEGYGRSTATGHRATQGRTVAVDPKVVPYGSKVKIKGLGVFRAEDCGGGVKGKHIDVFFNNHSDVERFGKKYLPVEIKRL